MLKSRFGATVYSGLGLGTLETLVNSLNEFDFAVLVLTPDILTSRGASSDSPRDNVLLELGLFIGYLGRQRTFIVYNRDNNLKLQSDLAGVTPADYGDRQDGNIQAGAESSVHRIRYAIKSQGTFMQLSLPQIGLTQARLFVPLLPQG